MSRARLLGISDKHPRTVVQIGSRYYVEYAGDFGDGKLWRTFGPEGNLKTREEAEAIMDNDQLLIDSWNSRAELAG